LEWRGARRRRCSAPLVMDRPASLCWEGVALGWREVAVARPRSRGGEMGAGGRMDAQPHSLRLDSGLNSLEYWDYSVELECLSGPEGRLQPCQLGHLAVWAKSRVTV
jgi:hypothetical protein